MDMLILAALITAFGAAIYRKWKLLLIMTFALVTLLAYQEWRAYQIRSLLEQLR
jgi:hypothetical protein